MHIEPSSRLQGLYYIHLNQHKDARGLFLETFKQSTWEQIPEWGPVVQMNLSHSGAGVIRGLHYQAEPYAQGKLILCLAGEILDVALDMRPDSPTYGQWESVVLKGITQAVFMAPGFAHGFEALAEQNSVHYLMTESEYHPESELGVAYNDPFLNIPWQARSPLLSEKDRQWPNLKV